MKKYQEKRTWEEKRHRSKTPWPQAKAMRRATRNLKKKMEEEDK